MLHGEKGRRVRPWLGWSVGDALPFSGDCREGAACAGQVSLGGAGARGQRPGQEDTGRLPGQEAPRNGINMIPGCVATLADDAMHRCANLGRGERDEE